MNVVKKVIRIRFAWFLYGVSTEILFYSGHLYGPGYFPYGEFHLPVSEQILILLKTSFQNPFIAAAWIFLILFAIQVIFNTFQRYKIKSKQKKNINTDITCFLTGILLLAAWFVYSSYFILTLSSY